MSKVPKVPLAKSRSKQTAEKTAAKRHPQGGATATARQTTQTQASAKSGPLNPITTKQNDGDPIAKKVPASKRRNDTTAPIPTNLRTQSVLERGKLPSTKATPPAKPTDARASGRTTSVLTKRSNAKASESPSERAAPLRAKHSPAKVEAAKQNAGNRLVKKNPPVTSSVKPNVVLDTYHNVTVSSPPLPRKGTTAVTAESAEKKAARKLSHTLAPDEVVVLKRESAKKRSEEQIQADLEGKTANVPVQESIAFEVPIDVPEKNQQAKNQEHSKSRQRQDEAIAVPVEDEQSNYSDDFESYESDFETGSSSPHDSTTTSERDEDVSEGTSNSSEGPQELSPSIDDDKNEESDARRLKSSECAEETDEESEATQYPVTVIQRDKEWERKLDSGNYEMNSRKHPQHSISEMQSTLHLFDSLETTACEQLDSGISSYVNATGSVAQLLEAEKPNRSAVTYAGYAQFNTRPIFSERGLELMSKIQFDTLTFTLFDRKPIDYDIFMQTYGQLNTAQCSTQTQEHRLATECQTEECDMRTMWTQHPPQFDLETVRQLSAGVQNCCGEPAADDLAPLATADQFDRSLQALTMLRHQEKRRGVNKQLRSLHKSLDGEQLSSFLLYAEPLMARILNSTLSATDKHTHSQHLVAPELSPLSDGCYKLGTRLLDALQVVRVFANKHFNLVITVHESLPEADVYRADFSNLLMVWSTEAATADKPIRLLSTWSEVCRAEICFADIVVCGLRDGSIAMWDLRETYSFCSKLDGHLQHFAATHSIVPTWGGVDEHVLDLGPMIDVRSFRAPPKALGLRHAMTTVFKSIQFASLNDTGILTVWTLVEIASENFDMPAAPTNAHYRGRQMHNESNRFEYSSPWARVKLIQSAICSLRHYFELGALKAQSQFDRISEHFQQNIYSDAALRELNAPKRALQNGQDGMQGMRFTSIDCGCERIYVCTNRNFVLACSKTLKTERFRKITINESRFLFPTALCVLSNENFLAVGLSNGSVMIVNCDQQKTRAKSSAASTSNSSTAEVKAPIATVDGNLETGKSCAIQNIILNERRSFDDYNAEDAYHSRPTTAACIAMITSEQRPFELRVYDQQLLLSGCALRKHLVQSLELSSDGWRLFALSNGRVRTYDFYLDREQGQGVAAAVSDDHKIVVGIAVARSGAKEQHLLVLNACNDVEVHLLKQ